MGRRQLYIHTAEGQQLVTYEYGRLVLMPLGCIVSPGPKKGFHDCFGMSGILLWTTREMRRRKGGQAEHEARPL